MLNFQDVLTSSMRRQIALGLAVIVAMPLGASTVALGQHVATPQQTASVSSSQSGAPNPDSGKPRTEPQAGSIPDASQRANAPSGTHEQQNGGTPAPVGTAVAPYEKGIGIAASRPAGAVIAPAKQRRTRSFVIKAGLIIGAAVAVGTVVGLSSGSPSRPQVQ
ncbi:MAG: hypothetical protein ACJ72H_29020 [Candidatus Sulfotelmatobacter sp.]